MSITEAIHELNYLAVLGVAIIGYIFGFIWFMLIFGKASKAAMNAGAPEGEKRGIALPMIKSFVLTLISTLGLAILVEAHGAYGRRHCGEFAAVVGVLVVGARLLNDGVWKKTPCKLLAISFGHEVLLFTIQGTIFGMWR
jgi:hypothetical protein